jgi:hypothetical protein
VRPRFVAEQRHVPPPPTLPRKRGREQIHDFLEGHAVARDPPLRYVGFSRLNIRVASS